MCTNLVMTMERKLLLLIELFSPNDPLAGNQSTLVDLEKEGLPPSTTSEQNSGIAREQRDGVETGLGLDDVEYGTARHGGHMLETTPPVNVDLPGGRLRYPDGDDGQ